jgi:hypothetical protein
MTIISILSNPCHKSLNLLHSVILAVTVRPIISEEVLNVGYIYKNIFYSLKSYVFIGQN